MHEHEAILEDLKKYLKDKEMSASVYFAPIYYKHAWVIDIWITHNVLVRYLIVGDKICNNNGCSINLFLADPEYREKFYQHLLDRKQGLKDE